MKKIAIFQANLKVGGIQRSLVNLLNSGIFNEYEVDVYLFSKDIFYNIETIPNNIHIKYLQPFPYWYRFIPFEVIRKIAKCEIDISDYDFAIDYDSYRQECAYYTTCAVNADKIMWIHNDMLLEYKYNRKYRILYHFFKNKYKYYDQFVAVSEGVVESFVRATKDSKEKKITIVPNIISVNEIIRKKDEITKVVVNPNTVNIVCMGRIYVQKGYDILLRDFGEAYKKRPDLRLYIIGDGPDKKKYQEVVEREGLSDKVLFLGNQENPFAIMKQMDAFCMESRYEGQGMVFMEAKVLGLQLIVPKHLEKYNVGLKGVENVVEEMLNLKKVNKEIDNLDSYHKYLFEQLGSVFSSR